MPRKTIVIVLPEVDRVRWQGAADLALVELDRFVRDAVEAEIARRERARTISVPGWPGCRD
jgi:hypothetical protein